MISHVLLIPINGIGEFSGLIDIARERIGKSFVNKKNWNYTSVFLLLLRLIIQLWSATALSGPENSLKRADSLDYLVFWFILILSKQENPYFFPIKPPIGGALKVFKKNYYIDLFRQYVIFGQTQISEGSTYQIGASLRAPRKHRFGTIQYTRFQSLKSKLFEKYNDSCMNCYCWCI